MKFALRRKMKSGYGNEFIFRNMNQYNMKLGKSPSIVDKTTKLTFK